MNRHGAAPASPASERQDLQGGREEIEVGREQARKDKTDKQKET